MLLALALRLGRFPCCYAVDHLDSDIDIQSHPQIPETRMSCHLMLLS